MDFLNENKLEKSIEDKVITKDGIIKTTDNSVEINGASYYGDLSKLARINNDREFIKKLKDECDKTSSYSNRIVYIPVNTWSTNSNTSPINKLLKFIKNNPDKFKEWFSGITFIFINSNTGESFALVVDMYESNQFNTITGLLTRITASLRTKAVTGERSPKKTVEKK